MKMHQHTRGHCHGNEVLMKLLGVTIDLNSHNIIQTMVNTGLLRLFNPKVSSGTA